MNGWLFSITFRDRRLDSCYISISFEAFVRKIPGHLRTLRRACPTHEGYHYWRPLLLVKGIVCSLRFSLFRFLMFLLSFGPICIVTYEFDHFSLPRFSSSFWCETILVIIKYCACFPCRYLEWRIPSKPSFLLIHHIYKLIWFDIQ